MPERPTAPAAAPWAGTHGGVPSARGAAPPLSWRAAAHSRLPASPPGSPAQPAHMHLSPRPAEVAAPSRAVRELPEGGGCGGTRASLSGGRLARAAGCRGTRNGLRLGRPASLNCSMDFLTGIPRGDAGRRSMAPSRVGGGMAAAQGCAGARGAISRPWSGWTTWGPFLPVRGGRPADTILPLENEKSEELRGPANQAETSRSEYVVHAPHSYTARHA